MRNKIIKIDPKEYYYGKFRDDFNEFIKKTNAHPHSDTDIYISIQSVTKESLSHILQENRRAFAACLAFTVLIDQVMYSHFAEDYDKFQKLTLYPKFEYGISWHNVPPWDLYSRIVNTLSCHSRQNTFSEFTTFFISEYKSFFTDYHFKKADWQSVHQAMLNDPDVAFSPFGKIFIKLLENN